MTDSDRMRADAVLRALTRATAATHDVAELLIANTGQSLARWQVLDQFAASPATVPSVARRLDQTRQSTQRIADILASEGLIERRENPDHRTSPLFEVTEKGEAVLEGIAVDIRPWLDHVGSSLSSNTHEVFVEQLLALREIAVAYRATIGR